MKGNTMRRTRRVTRLSRVERVHGPGTRHQGPSKRGNEKLEWGKRPLEPLLPRPTKHPQRWMTVRPQHHRHHPLDGDDIGDVYYTAFHIPFLYFVYFFGLDIIRQNRFQQPVQFGVGSMYGFPTTVLLLSSTSPYRCLFLSTLPPP
jgi:hypothetical protein